jgi:LysR family glycine cleavage system transcriptional activator
MKITPRRLLPSTAALSAFDAVARTGSFTAAAALLDLTQGAISRQIAQLEEQLGVKLVDREARGVRRGRNTLQNQKLVAGSHVRE